MLERKIKLFKLLGMITLKDMLDFLALKVELEEAGSQSGSPGEKAQRKNSTEEERYVPDRKDSLPDGFQ
jgi:hypothetical protein